ncbi:TlpA family protein disulfide reductase [Verrucomicrobiota bacterium]
MNIKTIFAAVLTVTLLCSCRTSGPCVSGATASLPQFPEEGKRLWAYSYIWAKAPELKVERWLTEKPDTSGKYVLVQHWNTWCPPCRRSIPLLNEFHKKYSDELVVIGITDETEKDIKEMKSASIEYYSAIDTQGRQKKELGVFGVPHVIILEPDGYVVWEGFPFQEGYELTEEKIEKILAVGRKLKAEKK